VLLMLWLGLIPGITEKKPKCPFTVPHNAATKNNYSLNSCEVSQCMKQNISSRYYRDTFMNANMMQENTRYPSADNSVHCT